jgi:hypothetical protein
MQQSITYQLFMLIELIEKSNLKTKNSLFELVS